MILRHAHRGEPNYCEWIDACYRGDACKAVSDAIGDRHHHHGYMAEYTLAKKLVDKANEIGKDPTMFASWF